MVAAAAVADLDPRNHHFEWRSHTGHTRRITNDQAAQFDTDGFFLLENVFSSDALAMVREAIEPHERGVNEFLRQVKGGRLYFTAADVMTVTLFLSKVSQPCRDLCFSAPMADLCHDLIGPDARLYWDQAVYKLPHNDEVVPWHQDNGYAFLEPQDYLTCWVPLVDATADNGAIWVVPGAHKRGTLAHWETALGRRCLEESTEGAVVVEAPAGSVVVFSSLAPHRTGPNITDGVRAAYILQYAPEAATVIEGDLSGSGRRVPQNDPDRQQLIVSGGKAVTPPPVAS